MAQVSRRKLIQRVEKLEPPIAREFLKAFASVRDQASVNAIADLIDAGRINDVVDMLGINPAMFGSTLEQIRNAFIAGGVQGMTELPVLRSDPLAGEGRYKARQLRVRFNFDLRNARAERWLAEESSRLVTEVIADQRTAIRAVVTQGTALGHNPRRTALDIVGRIGENGRRSGGIVGLTSQQEQFVANARAELGSGDATRMRQYLGRSRRDKRFDGAVNRAIKAGTPVAPTDVDKMVGRYADRMLQLRGENIARTEALAAFNEAREESFRQAVDTGAIGSDSVRKVWSATLDGRTRDAHAALSGRDVGLSQPFQSPTGARLMHPGDSSLGAGGADIINCRCMVTYKVDQIGETKRQFGL